MIVSLKEETWEAKQYDGYNADEIEDFLEETDISLSRGDVVIYGYHSSDFHRKGDISKSDFFCKSSFGNVRILGISDFYQQFNIDVDDRF